MRLVIIVLCAAAALCGCSGLQGIHDSKFAADEAACELQERSGGSGAVHDCLAEMAKAQRSPSAPVVGRK